MRRGNKLFLGIIIGVIALAIVFCIIFLIACAVNGISPGEQITQWFGSDAPVIKETVEEVVEQIVETPLA